MAHGCHILDSTGLAQKSTALSICCVSHLCSRIIQSILADMDSLRKSWKRTPAHVRKVIVLIIGMTFVIAAPFAAVFPGPGGIPIFLIGVAILATEFQWAERLQHYLLAQLKGLIVHYKRHRVLGNVLIALMFVSFATITYVTYTRLI